MKPEPDQNQPEPVEHEALHPPKPLPPVPEFPEIPANLRQRERDGGGSSLAGIGAGWALAIDFVTTIVAGFLIGLGIDWWQKTRPWGSLIGLGVGFGSAIIRILRQTQREERQRQTRK